MKLQEVINELKDNMQMRRKEDTKKIEQIHTTSIKMETLMTEQLMPMIKMFQLALYGGNGDKIGLVARIKSIEDKEKNKKLRRDQLFKVGFIGISFAGLILSIYKWVV